MTSAAMIKTVRLSTGILFSVLFGAVFFVLTAPQAQAAQLNQAYIRLNRLTASTATGGTVCARIATTASTDANIEVTFPTGFTVNSTASNWTVTTTNLPTGTSAMPGITTASGVSGQTVTFPISDISSDSTTYCFNFASSSTLTNPTAGDDLTGTITTTTSAPADIDTGNYALSIVSSDQISVTATVPSTFSVSFGSNSQALGTLSSSSVTSGTGVGITVGTNAANGWIGWVSSANAALDSSSTSDSIATTGSVDDTPSTLSSGTEGYVLDADLTTDSGSAGSGTVTVDAEYNGTDTSSGGALSTTFTEFASADGPTDGDVITLIPRVAISGLTQAASDYTDTLTVVVAGIF